MLHRYLACGVLLGLTFMVMASVGALAEDEVGVALSTNFREWLVVGVQKQTPNASTLIGLGGYGLSDLFWSLSARPWVQTFLGTEILRYAAGFDLIWSHPSFLPHRAYVGFGFTVSDFRPNPITNFMIGYRHALAEGCAVHMEARLLFINSVSGGFGCNISF